MPVLLRRADETGQDHVAKACLESMLLHARNLSEFLIEGRYKSSDIHRSDFTPTWSPPNSPAKKRLRDARSMMDRHLAHLSWDRVEVDVPEHDPKRISDDIVEVMRVFVDHLEAEANPAAEWFSGQLQQARLLLGGDRVDEGLFVSESADNVTALAGSRAGALAREIRERHLYLAPAAALRNARPAFALAPRAPALVAGALWRLGTSVGVPRRRDHG